MNKHQLRVMMSSKSNEWETPKELFDTLDKHYHFTLDAAAQPENALCKKYYTNGVVSCGRHSISRSGLEHSWEGESVFLNPPYGRGIYQWVEKAYLESLVCDKPKVILIPARTETEYFFDFCTYASEIYFLKGRISFGNRMIPGKIGPATFPSVVVVFQQGNNERDIVWCKHDFSDMR